MTWTGWETLWEVRDGSGDPPEGLERVGGPSGRSGTDRSNLGEVRDGSGDPRGGPGRFGEPSGRSGMGTGTLGEIRNGSGDFPGGPGWVGGLSDRSGEVLDRVGGHSRRSWTNQVNPRLGPGRVRVPSGRSETGRGTFGQVRDGSWEPRGGPGQVGGPSARSGTGRGTLVEVRNGSGDPRAGPISTSPRVHRTRSGPPRGSPYPSWTSRRVP